MSSAYKQLMGKENAEVQRVDFNAETQRRRDAEESPNVVFKETEIGLIPASSNAEAQGSNANAETQRRRDAEERNGAAFKETEAGLIPVEWDVVRIGEIASSTSGGTPSRKKPEYFDGEILWVKSGELNDSTSISSSEETITSLGLESSNAKLFPAGTLLVALYGATAGKVGILAKPATTNQAVCAIFPSERAREDFLFYVLMHRRVELLSERYGGAQSNLSQRVLRIFPLPLPPLSEQRAIAGVLRAVQRAREATKGVITAARELKRSMMRHLFTYGPVPVTEADRVPLKETEVGRIPVHWEVVQLGEILTEGIKNGAFVKRKRFGSGIPFLNVADTYEKISVRPVGWERVEATDKEIQTYQIQPNDLFFVRSSLKREGIGQCCIMEEVTVTAIYDCHLMRVRVRGAEVEPKFLAYYAASARGKASLIARPKTTTMTTINQRGLAGFELPLPPLTEQRKITHILSTIDAKIAAEEARLAALDALFASMLHHLMTGKIRVPLKKTTQRR